jgi:hypothetical protein
MVPPDVSLCNTTLFPGFIVNAGLFYHAPVRKYLSALVTFYQMTHCH